MRLSLGKGENIDLKNKSEEEVARLVAAAASEKGGKKKITKGGRVRRTRRESVQGAWAAGGLSGRVSSSSSYTYAAFYI